MHVIKARGVNDAYAQGIEYLEDYGELQASRAGPVLVAPTPVATVYSNPQERVLFDSVRDANPFFHLFESLYLLAGWRDARWLDQFVENFSARFAEHDGNQHGSYGFRWRHHFDIEGGGSPNLPDQLDTIVRMLRSNPADRRAVLTMWDPAADLGVDRRDIPCNSHCYFRVRQGDAGSVLDITVCCRSNDIIWGCYGANAVHFSILQEYLAGRVGVGVGTYTQVSNNYHAYTEVFNRIRAGTFFADYPKVSVIGNDWETWDDDLRKFMSWTVIRRLDKLLPQNSEDNLFKNTWFQKTAMPMFVAHRLWSAGDYRAALSLAKSRIGALDWQLACVSWMQRRLERAAKAAGGKL